MTFDQLRYFYEAAKYQHVGKAAKAIHISPSAISSAIASLESEFNCALFERIGRGIVLTAKGKYLQSRIDELFNQMGVIEADLRHDLTNVTGSFRLAGSHFLAIRHLAHAWGDLQQKHHGLQADLYSMNTVNAVSEVLAGTLDLALCFSPLRHASLHQKEIYRGTLRLVVRKGHPVLGRSRLRRLADLSKYPATIHKSAPGVDICESHPMFEKHKINPQIQCSFDSDDQAVQCIKRTDSWSLLPDIVVKHFKNELVALPLPKDWDAPFNIAIVTRANRQTNAGIGLLVAQLETLFQ